ncbi:MAG: hypothetical protein KAX20_01945 [Candidatus Omnitrophica bacterium]|nr:hypothetical protein [Candidatus Omnitrophota bacterium]
MKPKQKDAESIWTHFILEAYCFYYEAKDKYIKVATAKSLKEFSKELEKDEKDIEWKVVKNPDYTPDRRRPRKCKDPGYPSPDKCLSKGKMCPFFGWCSVEKEEYRAMMKAWEKVSEQIDRRIEREEKINKM